MTDTVDIEELEGRAAYDRGEPWSVARSELWRRGWITQQMQNGLQRQRAEREHRFQRPRTRRHRLDPHQAFEDVARQMTKGDDKP